MFKIPEIMGATNPVPGYDSNAINRNISGLPETNTQIQNVTDPSRVVGPDGKTERQDNGATDNSSIRYDSSFQTFLGRLMNAPNLAESFTKLFAVREGTVVLSGMSEGIAAEMAQALSMIRMNEEQLLKFLTEQFKSSTRFGGAFFALLRNAYGRASSDTTRMDILQFAKAYMDYSSREHLEGNILRNLKGMADSMPENWAGRLRDMAARIENLIAAGDQKGSVLLLQQEVFPLMSTYVRQTHDLGTARQLLSLLTLDISRYENGLEDNLLESFHRLISYGTLKEQLGGIDDQALLKLLQANKFAESSAPNRFSSNLNEEQLLKFLTGQLKSNTSFGGEFFALLRGAYGQASSDATRMDILQLAKAYINYSSKEYLEGNILRNLKGMADLMPESWAGRLEGLTAQMKGLMAAGNQKGSLLLLQQEVFPFLSSYLKQNPDDAGTARQLLNLLSQDMSRYENGSEENLLESIRQLARRGALKEQLGGIDDQALQKLIQTNKNAESPSSQFSSHLASAAAHALSGEGSAEIQEVFQQLVGAMLVNESVYMPVNHFILPLEWEGKFLFSEVWVDPDAQNENDSERRSGHTVKILFKMDVQDLGMFDIILSCNGGNVHLNVSCPEKAVSFSGQIEQAMAHILVDNGLTPAAVNVRRMERPVALTEVFPQIFERKNGINVKV